MGLSTWLANVDITSAFKAMPIHPDSWHLFGVCWHRKFYFFVHLTVGCKATPRFYDVLSEAAYWICQTITQSNPHSIYPFRQLKLFWVLNSLSDAARALPVEQICFSLTTGKAHPSDAMSIELPSDAARASRSGKPWLFHPTTGKAFPSDVASIELLSDTARAFPFEWMFSFNYQWCLPIRAVSIELPSNVARAFWICFSFNYRWCLPAHAVSIELPSNVTIAFRSSKPWPFSTSTGEA